MIAQGSALMNAGYYTSLEAKLKSAQSCAELQSLATEALGSIGATKTAITAELAKIQPILELLTAPEADPAKIVTWIQKFITSFLTPYVVPVTTYQAQLVELEAKIAALGTAIAARAAEFESCTVALPTL